MRDILAQLAEIAPTPFAPGEYLMQEGEETGRLYVLKSGTVEIRRHGTLVTQIAEPGAVLGEISTLLERPHTATVVAVTPVEVLALADGVKSLEAQPALALHMAVLLAQRLERSTALLTALKGTDAGKPQRRSLVRRVLGLLTGQSSGAAKTPRPSRQPRPR